VSPWVDAAQKLVGTEFQNLPFIGLSLLKSSKLTLLNLKNSSCCAGLKQFQILRSASPRTFEQKAQNGRIMRF
jgi:hypothetical protein